MSETEVKQAEETKVDTLLPFKIFSKDGQLLYTTSQEELDDCFYQIISLMSWTKTFTVGSKLKLTFNTITNDEKMKLLAFMKKWSEDTDASPNMFDEQINKVNLSYYLSFIEMNSDGINIREKILADRQTYFGLMVDNSLQLYGTYLYVFLEIIRKAMLSQVSLKNS